jgi:hypothetical protein
LHERTNDTTIAWRRPEAREVGVDLLERVVNLLELRAHRDRPGRDRLLDQREQEIVLAGERLVEGTEDRARRHLPW